MPACGLSLMRSPVSNAPHSFPLAKNTCCILESLLGRRVSVLSGFTALPTTGAHAGSAMQSRSGTEPAFWNQLPGTAYGITFATLMVRDGFGDALASEDVFDIVHTRSRASTPLS